MLRLQDLICDTAMTPDAPHAYQQIKASIMSLISSGELREGDTVPSENEISKQFSVARMTANRALRELVSENVLYRVKGSGTFVSPPKHSSTLVAIRSISDEIVARGQHYSSRLLELDQVEVSPSLRALFCEPECDRLFHSRLLHLGDGVPLQYEERWVNPSLASGYLEADFASETPNQFLMRVAPLERVEYRIEVSRPTLSVRNHLGMGAGEPALLLWRRTFSKSAVASVADLWHSGERFAFEGSF